jgi:iron complex outermembrane receptor protein
MLCGFSCFPELRAQVDTCQYQVSGRIVDLETRESLPYATIQIRGTSKGASADSTGSFLIADICQEEFDLIISHIGYKRILHHHDVYHDLPVIYMARDELTLESIVIEGIENQGEFRSLGLSEIGGKTLDAYKSESLGGVLSNISGVSMLSTGQNISKPIIHGLHSNRVLIINNGLRHEFQNWGVEHAPEIDPSLAGRIQVVKGAATVRYGPEALGGVVLIDGPEMELHEDFNGQIGTTFNSNGRSAGADLRIQQGFNRTAYIAQASYVKQGDLRAPDYMLTNTGKEEKSIALGGKFHQPDYTLSGYYSYFSQELGILRSSVSGNLEDLENAINADEPAIINSFSYDINNPKQQVDHHLVKLQGEWFKGAHVFEFQYGFQANHRQEFDIRRGTLNERPSIDLKLFSHSLDLNWDHPEFKGWNGDIGLQWTFQDNNNQPGTNTVAFIPNYTSNRIGLYIAERKKVGENVWEWGLRYDLQAMNIRGRQQDNSLYVNNLDFQNISATIGFSRRVSENMEFRTNAGTAWRPPNVYELYVFGRHQSTIEYGLWRYTLSEDGEVETDVLLDASDREVYSEVGFKWINTLDYVGKIFQGELTGYVNYISNFIFSSPGGTNETVRGAFPFFLYDQTDALLTGIDATGRFKHSSYWNSSVSLSYVYARDIRNHAWFVEIPPFMISYEMAYKPSIQVLPNSELGIKLSYQFNQWNAPETITVGEIQEAQEAGESVYVPGATFDFMDAPDGFLLANLYFTGGLRRFDYRLDVQNLFNQSYRMYTNRMRYFADEPGINIRLTISYSF